jgi:glycosyltransferase involved in cell wall biosynthesis
MNVLLVHNFYQQAGGEDLAFADEGRLLESRGHSVVRFTMHNDAIQGMGRLELARKTIWNRDAQRPLRQAIRESHAHVVHFHNTFPLISPAAYYTAHEAGAAVVQTLHNYRLICPGATFQRQGRVCEDCLGRTFAWPGAVHRCYRGNRLASTTVVAMLWYHRLKQTWRNQVDVYIALTEFSRRKFIEGGLPEERIVVKPNFIDPDPGIGQGDGGFALCAGRLAPEKGVETLLQAWPAVYRATGIGLKITGDGPLRPVVAQAAEQKANGIEYLARRPLPELYLTMGLAKALVVPSQWYEGQPRTILESFAKGTPVAASGLGSMPELIEPGRTGILFEPGNPQDLAERMGAMLSASKAEQARMRLAARSEFELRYTADENYPLLMKCYEAALAAFKNSRGS